MEATWSQRFSQLLPISDTRSHKLYPPHSFIGREEGDAVVNEELRPFALTSIFHFLSHYPIDEFVIMYSLPQSSSLKRSNPVAAICASIVPCWPAAQLVSAHVHPPGGPGGQPRAIVTAIL